MTQKLYHYAPQPDITTHELAQLVPVLIANRRQDIEPLVVALTPGAARHLIPAGNVALADGVTWADQLV
jgi:hypothetical protein